MLSTDVPCALTKYKAGAASCGIVAPPFVVSVSYGQDEASVTAAYAQRQCAEYAKLGLLGTTVLYSSGDDGVAGGGGACIDTRGWLLLVIENSTRHHVQFTPQEGSRPVVHASTQVSQLHADSLLRSELRKSIPVLQ